MEDRTLLSGLTVTNNRDSGPGSLRDAITRAAPGERIDFAPSLDGQTIRLTSGELDISTSLDIEGPDAGRLTISGGSTDRVLDVNGSGLAVTIAGLTIADGLAPQGGGIIDQGGALTLNNDVIANNRAVGVNPGDSALGGGVFVTVDALGNPGTLTVQSSAFRSNVAQGAPGLDASTDATPSGGGGASGGAIEGDQGTTITVTGSSFDGNEALGGRGGNDEPAQPGNGPAGPGGAGDGGAILTDFNATLTVAGSRFLDNLARGGPGGYSTDAYSAGGGGIGNGGAVVVVGGYSFGSPNLPVSLVVSNSSFTGNIAQAGAGGDARGTGQAGPGGFAGAGAVDGGAGIMDVSGSQFTGNQALGARGGDGPRGATGSYTGGGAILAGGATILDVSTSFFRGNQSLAGNGGTSTQSLMSLHGLAGWADGGAIEDDGDTFYTGPNSLVLDVTSSSFTGNVARGGVGDEGGEGWGGGLFVEPSFNSNFRITDSRFTANRAIGGNATSGDLPNPGFGFSHAGGDGLGGGLMTPSFTQASGTISGCAFVGNVTLGGNGGSGGTGTKGGFGGSAGGSGILFSSYADTLDVESSQFVGNVATAGRGGAGGAGADGGIGGYANGAGLYNFGADLTLNASSFLLNTATAGAGGAAGSGGTGGPGGNAYGGGVSSDVVNTAVSASTFAGNMIVAGAGGAGGLSGTGGAGGDAYGGGLEVEGNAAISDSRFTGNVAIGGAGGRGATAGAAGFALGGGIAQDFGNFTSTLSNSAVLFNMAIGGDGSTTGGDALGGGVGIMGPSGGGTNTFTIDDSTISGNAANGGRGGHTGGDGLGGGLYADATTTVSMTGVAVQYNLAAGGPGGQDGEGIGGGVYVLGTFTFDPPTVITRNRATTHDNNIGP